MKTYILRDPDAGESQFHPRNSRTDPGVAATTAEIQAPHLPAASSHRPTLFIGLDVHNDSIAVSLAPSHSTEVRRYGIISGSHDGILRLMKKLQAVHPGVELKFCYEAGPRGYPLCRFIRAHGASCMIVAPSKVPRKPGDRVKTDRRDAHQLARLYRAGELEAI